MNPQHTFEQPTGMWHTDLAAWVSSAIRIGGYMFGAAYEGLIALQVRILPSNSPASYEKNVSLTQCVTTDPSDYQRGILRDACAHDFRATVGDESAPIQTGRAWATYHEAKVAPGSDGLAIGAEIGLANFGSDQPLLDTTTSKYNSLYVAGEHPNCKPSTAAIHFTGGNAALESYFHHALSARMSAFFNRITGHGSGKFIALYKPYSNEIDFEINGATGKMTLHGRVVKPEVVTLQDGSVRTVLTLI